MKILILISVLIIHTEAFGQMEKTFTSKDSSDIPRLIDLIVKNTKNKYRLKNINTIHENTIEVIYSNAAHNLIFEFTRNQPGGDTTSSYTFISLTGLYEDVFPFWKKYYQPDAKMAPTAKATHGKVIITSYVEGKMISSFNKYGDYWELENRYSGKR
ncbi:MAG: hypothetical protein ABJA71_04745 [Ginsengibacter sp.]